jgi:uncharacterized protein DUF5317
MVTTVILGVIAVVLGLARGGSMAGLAATRLQWMPVLFGGLAIQVVIGVWSPDWLTDNGELAILVASNALVAVFIAANRRLPGILLAGLGLALNLLVITANGAMPVSDSAAEMAGIEGVPVDAGLFKHEHLDDDTILPWIGDVIGIPVAKEVVSLGDVVLALGIARLIYYQTTSNRRGRHRLTEASG